MQIEAIYNHGRFELPRKIGIKTLTPKRPIGLTIS